MTSYTTYHIVNPILHFLTKFGGGGGFKKMQNQIDDMMSCV